MVRMVAVVALCWTLAALVPAWRVRVEASTGAGCPGASALKLRSRPIVAFGDDITWGTNAARNCVRSTGSARPLSAHLPGSRDTTYPADLARLLHATVLDYGLRGETTDHGLKRIAGVLAAADPREVLVLEGLNDLLWGDQPAVIVSRLVLMCQLIQSYGASPVLLTLYPPASTRVPAARVRALDSRIRNQGELRGFRVIDLAGVLRQVPHALAHGLYPTDTGYHSLAARLATALQRRQLQPPVYTTQPLLMN